MANSPVNAFDSWTSPFEEPVTRPEPQPARESATAESIPVGDLDLSVLSVPQLPMFTAGRHGIALTDIQDWYKNTMVPRFLETLELVKNQHRHITALEKEQHQTQTAMARNDGELQALRQQVQDLTAQLKTASATTDTTHRVLERAQVLADQLIADAEADSATTLDHARTEAMQIRQAAEVEVQALIGDARKFYENHQAIVQRLQVSSQQAVQTFRTLADELETSAQTLAHQDPLADPQPTL